MNSSNLLVLLAFPWCVILSHIDFHLFDSTTDFVLLQYVHIHHLSIINKTIHSHARIFLFSVYKGLMESCYCVAIEVFYSRFMSSMMLSSHLLGTTLGVYGVLTLVYAINKQCYRGRCCHYSAVIWSYFWSCFCDLLKLLERCEVFIFF